MGSGNGRGQGEKQRAIKTAHQTQGKKRAEREAGEEGERAREGLRDTWLLHIFHLGRVQCIS